MKIALQRLIASLILLNVMSSSIMAAQIYQSDFDQATDVAVSADGRVWVLDGVNALVKVFRSEGEFLFSFGGFGHGDGQLNQPMGLAVDHTQVYVADTGNHRIMIFSYKGEFLGQINLQQYKLQEPVALAVVTGELFWSDRRNHQVCRRQVSSGKKPFCWGSRGSLIGQFHFPFQLAVDGDGYVSVVDVLNQRVQQFHRNGRYIGSTRWENDFEHGLYRPNGLAISGADRQMFVTDTYHGSVSVYINFRYVGLLAHQSGEPIGFEAPVGLDYRDNALYVVEAKLNQVRRIDVQNLEAMISEPVSVISGDKQNNRCNLCHLSWSKGYVPDTRDQELPVVSEAMCYSCHHGAVIDSRTRIGHDSQHPDRHHKSSRAAEVSMLDRADSIAKQFDLTSFDNPASKSLDCGSCHTPHSPEELDAKSTLYPEHNNNWLRVNNEDGLLCQKCHASKANELSATGVESKGSNHPLGILFREAVDNTQEVYVTEQSLSKGLPSHLEQHGASLGQNRQLICQSCHQIHGGHGKSLTVLEMKEESDLCESCHPKAVSKSKEQARKLGVHPINIDLADKHILLGHTEVKKLNCLTCHSVHEGRENSANLSRTVETTEELCAACHEDQHADDQEDARNKNVHPVNIMLEESLEVAGRTVEILDCLSCHSMHDGEANTAALYESNEDGELCSNCHRDEQAVIASDHNLVVTAAESNNSLDEKPRQSALCGSCHSMHRAEEGSRSMFVGAKIPSGTSDKSKLRDELCLSCHQEDGVASSSVVEHYSHPTKSMTLRSNDDNMPLVDGHNKIAEFGEIACITCHSAHQWTIDKEHDESVESVADREGDAHSSFLNIRSPQRSFCVVCHGFDSIIKYKYFHDELSRDKDLPYLED